MDMQNSVGGIICGLCANVLHLDWCYFMHVCLRRMRWVCERFAMMYLHQVIRKVSSCSITFVCNVTCFFSCCIFALYRYVFLQLFDHNGICGLLHGLVVLFCLEICGGIVICLIGGYLFSLPIMFFLCVVFCCCNYFSQRSTSPPGGNQVDGLPPALSATRALQAMKFASANKIH